MYLIYRLAIFESTAATTRKTSNARKPKKFGHKTSGALPHEKHIEVYGLTLLRQYSPRTTPQPLGTVLQRHENPQGAIGRYDP